jgi:hypothetical protein
MVHWWYGGRMWVGAGFLWHTHLPTHARSIRKPLWVVLVCFGCADPPVHHPLETWYGTSYDSLWPNTYGDQVSVGTSLMIELLPFSQSVCRKVDVQTKIHTRFPGSSWKGEYTIPVGRRLCLTCMYLSWVVYYVQSKPDDVICVRSLYCQVQSNMGSSI